MKKIFIFGHKQPDTDSVISAITLSYLKNQLGMNTEPRILGEINNETKFVLDYFNTEVPKYLNDVKLKITDVNYSKGFMKNENESVYNCYKYMKDNKISTLPIVTDNNGYIGAISTKDIIKDSIEGNFEHLYTSYTNIIDTLNGKPIVQCDQEIEGNVLVASYKSTTFMKEVKLMPDTILIVGDRHSIIEYAINQKIKLIVLTGNNQIKSEHLEMAKNNKVNVISTPHDTFRIAKKIGLCNYVKNVNYDKKVTYVHENDDLSDFIDLANKTKFSNYPVLNKENQCLGIISLAEAFDKNKKQVILVDHNEAEQSVDYLEDAEILEIVDHHRIGVVGTSFPINFRNMPVGSTNTIIYTLYQENKIDIPNDIAGLIMAGILSDTLLFKSPITTDLDKEIVMKLSKQTNIDYHKFAMDMLKAGSNISNKSTKEIIYYDFKKYIIDSEKIGVGLIPSFNPNDILKDKEVYINLLNKIADEQNYCLVGLFITDIINDCSYCLCNDKAKGILEDAFDKIFEQGLCLPNILSRKKQIIPAIMNAIEKK